MKKSADMNRKNIIIVFGLLAIVLVICALTFAWFYHERQLYTYAHVEKPSTLAIKGYNQTTVEQISLSTVDLTDETHKASFVFCVTGKNLGAYKLELAYTTNVPFTYNIRPTSQSLEQSGNDLTYKDSNGTSYFYSVVENELANGTYVNKENGSNVAVTAENNEKDRHEYAYNQYDRNLVQKHAEPVYYLFDNISVRNVVNHDEFVDYYILELTWDNNIATTYQKETDLVYLLAANSTAAAE